MSRLDDDQQKLLDRANVFRDTLTESELACEDCPLLVGQINEQIVVLDLMRNALSALRQTLDSRDE